VEFAYIVWFGGINKALRLSHIYIFLEKSMKEGIADVQLTKRASELCCQGENNAYCRRFNNMVESFIIV
jgi:hypothetical protein